MLKMVFFSMHKDTMTFDYGGEKESFTAAWRLAIISTASLQMNNCVFKLYVA